MIGTRVDEIHAFAGEFVERGSVRVGVAGVSGGLCAPFIGQDVDDIWPRRLCAEKNGRAGRGDGGFQESTAIGAHVLLVIYYHPADLSVNCLIGKIA